MKKKFKKAVAVILTVTMAMSVVGPAFASNVSDSARILNVNELNSSQRKVIDAFSVKNIDVVMTSDGEIRLANPTSNNIKAANMALATSDTYPGPWWHMDVYDGVTSKKIQAASENALWLALGAWLGGVAVQTLLQAVVAAYGISWYIYDDEENFYYFTKYYYREMGPGSFGPTGYFMGDYEIKKVERITTNFNGTGGEVEETIQASTILTPTF